MLTIRKANLTDKIALEILRGEAYKNSVYLSPMMPSYNKWSVEDENSTVLVVEDNSNLVATARIKIIQNTAELEKRNRILNKHINFPSLIVDQTATRTNMQNMGLNTILRFVIISFGKILAVKSIIGLVNKDSPRYKSMLRYNYVSAIAQLTTNYSDYIVNHTTPMLLELHHSNFDKALEQIKKSKAYKKNEVSS